MIYTRKMVPTVPITGGASSFLVFFNQNSEVGGGGGGQNNNNNLFKVITLSKDYKYTTSHIKKNERSRQEFMIYLFISVVGAYVVRISRYICQLFKIHHSPVLFFFLLLSPRPT